MITRVCPGCLRAEPEWSRFELFSDKKNNKKKGDECLK